MTDLLFTFYTVLALIEIYLADSLVINRVDPPPSPITRPPFFTCNHLVHQQTSTYNNSTMAAMVQSFPSTGSTITMLQTRSPSSEAFQSGTQSQQHQRGSQVPRNLYHNPMGASSYRGHTSLSPSASYSFNSPVIMPSASNPLRQHPTMPRYDTRTASAPVTPFTNPISSPNLSTNSQNWLSSVSALNLSGAYTSQQSGSKDDTAIPATTTLPLSRPLSAIDLNTSASNSSPATSKPAPDRYKRNHRRAETGGLPTGSAPTQGGSALPSGSGMATIGHLYQGGYQTASTPTLTSYPSYRGSPSPSQQANEYASKSPSRVSSVDDLSVSRPGSSEQAKRYRRRSISSLDAKEYQSFNSGTPVVAAPQPKTYAATLASPAPAMSNETRTPQPFTQTQRPRSSHGRNGSNESSNSGRSSSRPSSVSIPAGRID